MSNLVRGQCALLLFSSYAMNLAEPLGNDHQAVKSERMEKEGGKVRLFDGHVGRN